MILEPGMGNTPPTASLPTADMVNAPGGLMWRLLVQNQWLTVRRYLLALLWISLAILTHIPVPQSVQGMGVSDKVAHVIGYFPLGLLLPLCRTSSWSRQSQPLNWGASLLILTGYGILDELLQIPVGRTASVLDWVADMIGILLGMLVAHVVWRRQDGSPQSTHEPAGG